MKINSKRFVKLSALILSAVMLFSGCGSKNTASNGSDFVSDEVQEQLVSEEQEQSKVSGSDNTNSKQQSGADTQSNTAASGKTTFEKDPYSDIPASVKSKGIHLLLWRDYTKLEKEIVAGFEKKTGIKVRLTKTTEQEYSTKLLSLVAGNDAPDVVYLISDNFPGLAIKSMQTLDTKTFRLNDSCWYKDYMDNYKVNGKYFSVAMAGSWSVEDCNYVTYYMPKVLKAAGVSEDPYTLYKQGKWNWDKQKEIANKLALKSGFTGLSIQTNELMMYSAGVDFVSYNGKEFRNIMDDAAGKSLLTKAWQTVAEMKKSKTISDWNLRDTQQGKVGLFTSLVYGMYKDAAYFNAIPHSSNDIKAVPVAGPKGGTAYTPVRPKTWGVAKKAKNPEGAAYFLRYFLDPNSCNMNSTFCNEQFSEVYKIITSTKTKKAVMLARGVVDSISKGTYADLCHKIGNASPSAVSTELNKVKGQVTAGVNRVNRDLKKVK